MKTSSGYYAGLQSGKDFKAVEQNLKRKHVSEHYCVRRPENEPKGPVSIFFVLGS